MGVVTMVWITCGIGLAALFVWVAMSGPSE